MPGTVLEKLMRSVLPCVRLARAPAHSQSFRGSFVDAPPAQGPAKCLRVCAEDLRTRSSIQSRYFGTARVPLLIGSFRAVNRGIYLSSGARPLSIPCGDPGAMAPSQRLSVGCRTYRHGVIPQSVRRGRVAIARCPLAISTFGFLHTVARRPQPEQTG